MDSTWETRDLPVLEAVVRLFDERPEVVSVTIKGIADDIGMQPIEVYSAAKALSPTYLTLKEMMAPLEHHQIRGVTDEARRAVGQWPSPDMWADRIVQALLDAAEQEPDEAKKTRLRATAEALAGFGRDVLVGVLSGGITQSMGNSG
jgi:hypothetical protein